MSNPEVKQAVETLIAEARRRVPGLWVPNILRWHLMFEEDISGVSIRIVLDGAETKEKPDERDT